MKPLTFKGPNPGILAIVFMILFNTGLSFVISFTGPPFYPGPWESAETIATYFRNQPQDVLMCAFFQFGSAIPLAILTAAFVSKLRFLGANPPGTYIALFGGFATACALIVSSSVLWVMAYPGIAQETTVLSALYYIGFAIGGVGYSVPLGLLIAGIAVTSGFTKVLPKWLVATGIILAVIGEASWVTMVFPDMLPLIPLTRFPGFIWLILAGFMMPNAIAANAKPITQ
jgi:hypothetical protein